MPKIKRKLDGTDLFFCIVMYIQLKKRDLVLFVAVDWMQADLEANLQLVVRRRWVCLQTKTSGEVWHVSPERSLSFHWKIDS